MRSMALRTGLFALLLVPLFLGMLGTRVHFIPNPSFRWIAAAVAILYCAMLFAALLKLAPRKAPDVSAKVPAPVKLAAGFPVIAYFVYVFFYMSLPAAYTQAFGNLARRTYEIESVEKGGAKALFCPYRLKLQGTYTVLGDTFCVGENFATIHSPGESVVLSGRESVFGVRFNNDR